MKKLMFLCFLVILNLNSFSQNIVRYTTFYYTGYVINGEYVWDRSDIDCGGLPTTKNKLIISKNKIIIKKNFYSRWEFKIKEYSGSDFRGNIQVKSWSCYDKYNKLDCIARFAEGDGEMILFEYEEKVIGVYLIKNY